MKKNVLLLAAILTGSLLSNSCKNDDSVGGSVSSDYLEVKVNGSKKNFSDVKARWIDGGNYLELTATNNGSEWISITVLSEATRVPSGIYTLDDNTPFTILSTYSLLTDNQQQNYTATRETVAPEDNFNLNIDVSNIKVSGTFSGTLVKVEGLTTLGVVTLSEGKFNISLQPN